MEKVKQLWSDLGQGVSVAFVVATLMAEQNHVLTGLFFALASGVAMFILGKMYDSLRK